MEKKGLPEDDALGPLQAVLGEEGGESDSEPEASGSASQDPKPEESYWLAHYYTRPRSNVGVTIMAIKYPLYWPKERVEQAAREVQAGDKFAVEDAAVVVRQESAVIKLFSASIALIYVTILVSKCQILSSPTAVNAKI